MIDMFERCTDRFRRVVAVANIIADSHGDAAIDAEHVMLALLSESRMRDARPGAAGRALELMAVDVKSLTRRLSSCLSPLRPAAEASGGRLPQTARFRRAIEAAIRESEMAQDEHAGTEHLLLGLLAVGDGVLGRLLREHGVDRGGIVDAMGKLADRRRLDDP